MDGLLEVLQKNYYKKLTKWIQKPRGKIALTEKKYGMITRLYSLLKGINKCISEGLIPVIDIFRLIKYVSG